TATAALRLVEEGKLELDAPVQKYCPSYPQKQYAVTSRHLLSHMSGVRHYYGANGESQKTEEERNALQELVRREQSTQYIRFVDVVTPLNAFKDDALLFQPGTKVLYTSLGYRLLGCVLEGAAQTSYRTLMRSSIFLPAGMSGITEDDSSAIIP